MEQIITDVVTTLIDVVKNSNPVCSIFMGSFLVILESIIPMLPLGLFIAINRLVLGNITGFILSWISTVIGCMISFYLFRKGFSKYLYRKIEYRENLKRWMKKISEIDFTQLVLITALPFTPAFSINIASGLSHISSRKFFFAMLIAKVFVVYFWGFIGASVLESLKDPYILIEVGVILILAYISSFLVNRKLQIR